MSRKKADNAGRAIGAVLGVIFFAAILAAAVLPLYLLLKLIQYSFQSRKLQRQLRFRETGCWLDDAEKVEFKRKLQQEADRIAANRSERARLQRLISLEHDKASEQGLTYNSDGLPRRTTQGSVIRENLERLNVELSLLDLADRQVNCRQPFETWDELNELLVKQVRMKHALMAWIVGASFFFFAQLQGASIDRLIFLFVSAALAGIGYGLAAWLSNLPAASRFPRPVYITPENVDVPEMDLPLRRKGGIRLVGAAFWIGLIAFSSVKGYQYGLVHAESSDTDAALVAREESQTPQRESASKRVQPTDVNQETSQLTNPTKVTENPTPPREVLKALPVEEVPSAEQVGLDPAKVETWDLVQVRGAINEIYARHGVVFPNKDLQVWASQQAWYQPVLGLTLEKAEELFSESERRNIELLAARRELLQGKGQIQPELRLSVPLPPDVIGSWDASRIQMEINSIYARYGVEFPTRDLQAWAEKQPDYKRIQGRTFDDADALLVPVDRSNVELLAARRAEIKRIQIK